MSAKRLVIGVDGGGTKTVAWLAARDEQGGEDGVVGLGSSGPSNPRAVGWTTALQNLGSSIGAAFADARIDPGDIEAACLAVAGSDREAERNRFEEWAGARGLARKVCIVNDAAPILAVGAPQSWGVALIAGTGSFAFAQDANGRTARAGGWGYVFGDEGSGYDIGRSALIAVARAADGRGATTKLTEAILARFGLSQPAELIETIYGAADVRGEAAALAELVCDVAEDGDEAAGGILDRAAQELAAMTAAVAARLDLQQFPLAVAGGLLVKCELYRGMAQRAIGNAGLVAQPVTVVEHPVSGAVTLARRLAGRVES